TFCGLDPFAPEMIPSVTGSLSRAASAKAWKTIFFTGLCNLASQHAFWKRGSAKLSETTSPFRAARLANASEIYGRGRRKPGSEGSGRNWIVRGELAYCLHLLQQKKTVRTYTIL